MPSVVILFQFIFERLVFVYLNGKVLDLCDGLIIYLDEPLSLGYVELPDGPSLLLNGSTYIIFFYSGLVICIIFLIFSFLFLSDCLDELCMDIFNLETYMFRLGSLCQVHIALSSS
jgi:hypothetical protein